MADGFGTNDILTGRGLGLFGFGYPGGYGGYGGYGGGVGFSYAAPAANAERINAADQRVGDQAMCTREVIASDIEDARNAFDSLAIDNKFATSRSETNAGFNRINDANLQNVITSGQAALSSERRQSDLFMNLNGKLEDMARDNAKCCCDIQLNQQRDTASILARMNTINTDNIRDQRDAAMADARTEKIINAIGCHHHPAPAPAPTCL